MLIERLVTVRDLGEEAPYLNGSVSRNIETSLNQENWHYLLFINTGICIYLDYNSFPERFLS